MKVGELHLQYNIQPLKAPAVNPPSNQVGEINQDDKGVQELQFENVLREAVKHKTPLKFSAHAIQRLEDRQIQLTAADLDRLERGINDLTEKGGRSSLILIDNQAYLVNIPSRTVITAMSSETGGKHVFTNVDSVAIV